jgi:hypothetical protein
MTRRADTQTLRLAQFAHGAGRCRSAPILLCQ